MKFPRQPKPVTIRIDGTDQIDIDYWASLFRKGVEHKGDNAECGRGVIGKYYEFIIYPRAVND